MRKRLSGLVDIIWGICDLDIKNIGGHNMYGMRNRGRTDLSRETFSGPTTPAKKIATAVGICLLAVGIILVAYGWSNFFGGGFEQATTMSRLLFVGGVFIMIGISLIWWSNIRLIYKYIAKETAPAVEIAGGAVGRGITTGIKETGSIPLTITSAKEATREVVVVRVKCRNCGYLETEDAKFCSKCGKTM